MHEVLHNEHVKYPVFQNGPHLPFYLLTPFHKVEIQKVGNQKLQPRGKKYSLGNFQV